MQNTEEQAWNLLVSELRYDADTALSRLNFIY